MEDTRTRASSRSERGKMAQQGEGNALADMERAKAIRTAVGETKNKLDKRLRETQLAVEIMKAKLDLLADLAERTDEEKIDILFDVWDSDSDGQISFSELAMGMRRFDPVCSLPDNTKAAMIAMLSHDDNRNQHLDRKEFADFIEDLTDSLGVEFHDVAELMILQSTEKLLNEEYESAVFSLVEPLAEAQIVDIEEEFDNITDERMMRLFDLFDRNHDGEIQFSEVAYGLKKLNPTASLEEARSAAVECMLAFDEDYNRTLSYPEFCIFIRRIMYLGGLKFSDVADTLITMASETSTFVGEDKETAEDMEKRGDTENMLETLADRRLHLIFDLWDTDGNGTISFSELCLGLRSLQTGQKIEETAADAACAMLAFDEDRDQTIDRAEFADFIYRFCNVSGYDFDKVADELVLVAAIKEDKPEEVEALKKAESAVLQSIKEGGDKLSKLQASA